MFIGFAKADMLHVHPVTCPHFDWNRLIKCFERPNLPDFVSKILSKTKTSNLTND